MPAHPLEPTQDHLRQRRNAQSACTRPAPQRGASQLLAREASCMQIRNCDAHSADEAPLGSERRMTNVVFLAAEGMELSQPEEVSA